MKEMDEQLEYFKVACEANLERIKKVKETWETLKKMIQYQGQ